MVRTEGRFEIRDYPETVVARTRATGGDHDDRTSVAFGRLFDYISGENRDERSIPMTAPVLLTPEDGAQIMDFVMPAAEETATLPGPSDPEVEIRALPPRRVVTYTFEGVLTASSIRDATRELATWMDGRGLRAVSTPRSAGYDPPWTLPFLRRNEIHVEIDADALAADPDRPPSAPSPEPERLRSGRGSAPEDPSSRVSAWCASTVSAPDPCSSSSSRRAKGSRLVRYVPAAMCPTGSTMAAITRVSVGSPARVSTAITTTAGIAATRNAPRGGRTQDVLRGPRAPLGVDQPVDRPLDPASAVP